jgi:hypothetical protein
MAERMLRNYQLALDFSWISLRYFNAAGTVRMAKLAKIIIQRPTHSPLVSTYMPNNSHSTSLQINTADEKKLAGIRCFLKSLQDEISSLAIADTTRRAVSKLFFGSNIIPDKAWDGRPFYPYFYGLFVAKADYIMHMDGDMMFGGGSQTWISEAIDLLKARPDILFSGPLPGPPHPAGYMPIPLAQAVMT